MRKQVLFSVMFILSMLGGLIVCPVPVMASVAQQTIQVGGQVVDQNGEALIGATVKVKGSTTGVATDFEGNFQLNAPSDATLVVSYVGYKDREIAVRGRAVLGQIQLESDAQILDQVVVVGYGTQKKADLTGSVSVVNADEPTTTSPPCSRVRWPVYRLQPTVSLVPILLSVSVVWVLSEALLLCM